MLSVIRVYSDFVCPYCFFMEALLTRIAKEKPLAIEWRPFELRPAPQPTLRPEGEYLKRVWRESVYPLAQRLGISISLPRISPQPHTGLAFEGYQYALDVGHGQIYTHRMFTAFFQEERHIGKLPVLLEIGQELGFDSFAFKSALENGYYRIRHQQALRHAREEMHITAVPTLVMHRHRLQGLPSLEQLRSFLNHREV